MQLTSTIIQLIALFKHQEQNLFHNIQCGVDNLMKKG